MASRGRRLRAGNLRAKFARVEARGRIWDWPYDLDRLALSPRAEELDEAPAVLEGLSVRREPRRGERALLAPHFVSRPSPGSPSRCFSRPEPSAITTILSDMDVELAVL
ncbi:MAG: hypothetical protein OZ921_17710 [Sorangiineae bacterium]|nr:hypothetical protein [Polyangiaceae bacterium]MEB2324355.1 hypothetical protein [Sorangiineae bacterium]